MTARNLHYSERHFIVEAENRGWRVVPREETFGRNRAGLD
jgi:hypothetical protein